MLLPSSYSIATIYTEVRTVASDAHQGAWLARPTGAGQQRRNVAQCKCSRDVPQTTLPVTAGVADFLRRWRHAAIALLCGGAMWLAGATAAEVAYPIRPIRVIVPQAPGGTVDLLSRVLAEKMEATLGVAVVVDDRPGANGIIGNELAKRAAPD